MLRLPCLAVVLTITVMVTVSLFCLLITSYSYKKKDSLKAHAHTKVGPMRYLITGAAGFIGFHLASTLKASGGNLVVGLDNLNDYYDLQLKIDRAHELHKIGVQFQLGDVCDSTLLENLFAQHNFTHVAHLAAQAGVRFSLKHPLTYVHSNVECQIVLLEVLKRYPNTKLIFASSSSVYGKESPVPFRTDANTDFPGNMYAATKKSDELLGFHYCQLYHLKIVGLRFFTVYGPWGRPDMAIYKFAESMMNGEDVPLYQASDRQTLGRDFTYIDDLIKGILSAFDYQPSTCGEHFNLGLGSPVSVSAMVRILQEELNVTAKIRREPLPMTEILKTWADIGRSIELLSFRPTTDLREGIRLFAAWYRGYRQKRIAENMGRSISASMKWFKESQAQRMESIPSMVQQTTVDSNKQRLSRHAQCVFREGNTTVCKCKPGFYQSGQSCITYLQQPQPRDLKLEYLAESYSVHNIAEMKSGKDMVFFQGMDSLEGDYLMADLLKDNHKKLVEACRVDPLCLAINTNGLMKRRVQSKPQWVKWSDRSTDGLFVYDVNYCVLFNEKCPERSQCTRLGPADFRCVCEKPYEMVFGECVAFYSN